MSAESDRLTALIAKIDAYILGNMEPEDVAKFRIGENQVEMYDFKDLWEIRKQMVEARDEADGANHHYVDNYDNGVTWTGADDTVYVGDE